MVTTSPLYSQNKKEPSKYKQWADKQQKKSEAYQKERESKGPTKFEKFKEKGSKVAVDVVRKTVPGANAAYKVDKKLNEWQKKKKK